MAARAIEQANPRAKVLFYLNAAIDWPGYEARGEFERRPESALRTGRRRALALFRERRLFDLSPTLPLREWWSGVCAKAMAAAPLDGVFMDAVPEIAMVERQNRRTTATASTRRSKRGCAT